MRSVSLFWNKMEKAEEIEHIHCTARTYFPVRKYNFKWILEGSSELENDTSPQFYPETENPWWLEMRRLGYSYISYLRLYRSSGNGLAHVECDFQATDGNGKILHSSVCSSKFENTTKYMTVLSGITVYEEENVKELSKDLLELTVKLKIYHIDIRENSSSAQYNFPTENQFLNDILKSVSDDFGKLYESQLNSDVSLSIEGETVQVHKAILSARSAVFAKMFQHEMVETTKNVIVIEDIKLSAMMEVVSFMYGTVKGHYSYDTAVEVYYAADKYDVNKLKEICSASLASQLNEINAGHVLNLADRHRDEILKKETMKFIAANMKSCIKTEWWWDLMGNRSVLAAELIAYIADFK